jgi:hypothetical protein
MQNHVFIIQQGYSHIGFTKIGDRNECVNYLWTWSYANKIKKHKQNNECQLSNDGSYPCPSWMFFEHNNIRKKI